MRNATTVLLVFTMATGCSGNKGEHGRKSSTGGGPDKKDCRAIQKRNLECIEVLVPMAIRNTRQLMEKAILQADESERAQLRARLEKSLASKKADFKRTLREGLKAPFMKWCTRAHRQTRQARTLRKVKNCLKQPDCKGYAECLGKIMEKTLNELLSPGVGARPSRPSRPAAGRPETRITRPVPPVDGGGASPPSARPESRPTRPASR